MYLTRFLLIFVFIISGYGHAQDERTFREVLLHDAGKKTSDIDIAENLKDEAKFKVRSSRFHLDITRDKKKESFIVSKIEGQDFLTFYDDQGRKFFHHKFDAHGPWSRLYKIQKRELSQNTDLLILHFFEGRNRYLELKSTARLYFLTIDHQDLKSISVAKGPILWLEHKNRQENYIRRAYELSIFDYDEDGIREVSVKHKRMSRVYKYKGKGEFVRPKQSTIL